METKTLSIKAVREALGSYVDSIGKNKAGDIVVRKGFFYTHGMDSERFSSHCLKRIREAGFDVIVMDSGEVWKPFRGGASVACSSHWYVTFR